MIKIGLKNIDKNSIYILEILRKFKVVEMSLIYNTYIIDIKYIYILETNCYN